MPYSPLVVARPHGGPIAWRARRFILAVAVGMTIAATELLARQQSWHASPIATLPARPRPHASPRTPEPVQAASALWAHRRADNAPTLSDASSASNASKSQLQTTAAYADAAVATVATAAPWTHRGPDDAPTFSAAPSASNSSDSQLLTTAVTDTATNDTTVPPATLWTPRGADDVPTFSAASSESDANDLQQRQTTAADAARSATLYVRFFDPAAGIGNKMFQYASGVGLAMRHGAEARLVVDSADVDRLLASMRRVFRLSPLLEQPAAPDVATLAESGWGRYDAARFDNPSNFERRNTTVVGYLQSWRYFEPVADRIRGEFSLTPFADTFADAFLRRTGAIERGQVIVGLHVRRGDMENRPDLYTLAPPEYVQKAVEHYAAKYGGWSNSSDGAEQHGITLVVATNDQRWVEVTLVPRLPANLSVFFTGFAAEEDMAVLSRCNHSIVTAGTFGWWSAWLAGGDVVYYKDFIRPQSPLYASHDPADYYPPHWLGMS